MANFVFNIAKGRVAEFYNRVQSNDPANSALILVAINTTATDATLRDLATLSAVLGDANTDEETNVSYSRIALTDADLGVLTVDNVNDRMPCDCADQTFSSITTSITSWTDLLFCYDPDTTSGTDASIIPLTCNDFAVTPDGSDITAQIADFYRAS